MSLATDLRRWWPSAQVAAAAKQPLAKPDALAELALCAQRSVCTAMQLQAAAFERGVQPGHQALEDHRTAVLGDLLTTLDGVSPGLGAAFMAALYPFNDTTPF